ncbi:MAG: undecaprenyldiphospho-muramoylpentapeptide beta-N-acetylglucosaminyltransferase [Flavobacteriales bacterium]|nr:undecaprenyldiphospho-muramoylpentapeptide beta-N-acetylglucosaminyltransferase [Flavobacteriales bacterium]
MKNPKVIISGGGTGGHIFPALAIANELKARFPTIEILFVGANARMEMTKVPEAGYEIIGLDVVGLQRRITYKNLFFPFLLLKSLRKAKSIVKSFDPNVVIGVGGYASGPTLKMASKLGYPTLIQEQNSYAGLTNKLLSKKAKSICVAYENMSKFFPADKIKLTGNPVRDDILNINDKRAEANKHFNIESNRKVVLILGGSLGAKSINEGVLKNIQSINNDKLTILWQVGSKYIDTIKENINREKYPNIIPLAFIKRMDLAYAAADVIVSRAGALSISEIAIVGKPAILVPSPNVSEDHQTKNAMSLVNNSAAIMVKDADSNSKLIPQLLNLINSEESWAEFKNNLFKIAKPNASKHIVDEVVKVGGLI